MSDLKKSLLHNLEKGLIARFSWSCGLANVKSSAKSIIETASELGGARLELWHSGGNSRFPGNSLKKNLLCLFIWRKGESAEFFFFRLDSESESECFLPTVDYIMFENLPKKSHFSTLRAMRAWEKFSVFYCFVYKMVKVSCLKAEF